MKDKAFKKGVFQYTWFEFACCLAVMLPMSYFNLFMTDNLLISAAAVGTLLLASRIIDFVVGLIAGGVVEKARFKSGKFRPWLNFIKWVVLISICLHFLDTTGLPMFARIIICMVGYIGLNCSMNFVTLSQFGLMALIAGPSMEKRNILSMRYSQALAAGSIVVSASALPVIKFLTPYIGNSNAYLLVAAVLAAVLFAATITFSNTAKAYDKPQEADSPGGAVSVKDMVSSVVTNGQLLTVILSWTLFYIATFIMNGIMAHYFSYVLGNILFMSISMTVSGAFGFIAALIAPKIGVKLGKKNAMVSGLLLYAFGSLAITVFAGGSYIVYTVLGCANSFFMYMFQGFNVNYMLDAGEYGYHKTGKDNRTVAMSMMNIPMKIGMALGGSIGLFGLSFIGFEAGMSVTTDFIDKFMWLLGGGPAIFAVLAALVMLFCYKISDVDAARYAEENAKKAAVQAELAMDI